MEPFEAYRYYQSIKLHFESDSYDAPKYNYKTSAKPQSFWKRRDKYFFAKLAKRFKEPMEIIQFYVANFVNSDKTWIGDMLESDELWKHHVRKTQSIGYTFKQDLVKLSEGVDSFDELFKLSDGTYPPILRIYLEGDINIETVVIIHKLTGFINKVAVNDPITWPDVKRKLLKYEPFLQVDLKKMQKSLLEVFTS